MATQREVVVAKWRGEKKFKLLFVLETSRHLFTCDVVKRNQALLYS